MNTNLLHVVHARSSSSSYSFIGQLTIRNSNILLYCYYYNIINTLKDNTLHNTFHVWTVVCPFGIYGFQFKTPNNTP